MKRTLVALGLVGAIVLSGTSGAVAQKLITSHDIKNGTIRSKDLSPALLKRIDRDRDTLQGLSYVERTYSISAGNQSLTADCPDGLYAFAGGAQLFRPNSSDSRVVYTNPTPGWTGWVARVDATEDEDVKVYLFCTPAAPDQR